LRYYRYADDFVLGAICPKSEAEEIYRKIDTVRKTAKVVDSCFGQATRMVDVKHEEAFQGLFMACVSGLEAVS